MLILLVDDYFSLLLSSHHVVDCIAQLIDNSSLSYLPLDFKCVDAYTFTSSISFRIKKQQCVTLQRVITQVEATLFT